jgi:type IX secretion system PorP/SprF family membrane protein
MNQVFKILVITAILSLSVLGAKAQDPHFSQYWANPLYLNPAQTGMFGCNYRFAAIYRSQWNSVLKNEAVPMYRTIGASYDMRFNKGIWRKDAIGVGLMFYNDKAGESKFGTNQLNFSFAYLKALGYQAKNYLSIGFQAGAAQRSMNGDLRFGNQFDGEGYNPALPSGEVVNFGNFMFFDINAGAFWYYAPKKRTNVYAGAYVYHLNRPSQSFYGGNDAKMYMKYGFHGGAQFPLAAQVDLLPGLMVMKQGPAVETNIGTMVKWFFDAGSPVGNAFYFGPYYRIVRGIDSPLNSEALILAAKMDYWNFTFGVSYDLNFSQLTDASNARGGFEVSAIYIGCFKKKNKLFCPRFN